MTQIELDDIVKEKLDKYKKSEGCKTYSDAVNILLSKIGLTTELLRIAKENQQLLKNHEKNITAQFKTKKDEKKD